MSPPPAHVTLHEFLVHRFVQSAPTEHVPVHDGVPVQSTAHCENASQEKLHFAPSSHVTSHVAPSGHSKVQFEPFRQARRHVRLFVQVKSQVAPAAHVQLSPQLPFAGPASAFGGVVPDEDDELEDDELEELEDDEDELEELEDDDVVAVRPASVPLPTFQSYEQPKTSESPNPIVIGTPRESRTSTL